MYACSVCVFVEAFSCQGIETGDTNVGSFVVPWTTPWPQIFSLGTQERHRLTDRWWHVVWVSHTRLLCLPLLLHCLSVTSWEWRNSWAQRVNFVFLLDTCFVSLGCWVCDEIEAWRVYCGALFKYSNVKIYDNFIFWYMLYLWGKILFSPYGVR